jgi:hypothetical protein
MHAIGAVVLVALAAAVSSACGGDSQKSPPARARAGGTAESGAGPVEAGGAGAEDAGAGTGAVDDGGDGGTAARGGADALGGSGGSGGTASEGGRPAAGSGPAAGSSGGGGAPNGGTSSIAGAGGATLIEPPPNCLSVRQSEDADSCSFEYTCAARTHFDSCRRKNDRIWACECGTFSTPTRYFEVEDAAGLEACGVTARACESEVTVSSTRICSLDERVVDGGSCSAKATCGNELELGSGPVVRAVEYFATKCAPSTSEFFAAGGFDCSCEGGVYDRAYQLVMAPSIDDACEPLLEFCMAEEPPVYQGAICGVGEPWGSIEQVCPSDEADCQGCVMTQECRKGAPIDRDVSLVGLEGFDYRSIVCRPNAGELGCSCETTVEGLYSDPTVPAAILDVCRESRELCPAVEPG